jgi:cyclic pyranopterin phosphate synthase
MKRLAHLDEKGQARMVDVGNKAVTRRRAVASGKVIMKPATATAIREGSLQKGEALAVARLAGIQAAKRAHELIPLAHPLPLEQVKVDFEAVKDAVLIRAEARVTAKTGVEMEALCAVAAAALAIYDMAKAIDRGMIISDIRLEEKSGGRSGRWKR